LFERRFCEVSARFFYGAPDVSRCCHGMKDMTLTGRNRKEGKTFYVSVCERSWKSVLPKTCEQ